MVLHSKQEVRDQTDGNTQWQEATIILVHAKRVQNSNPLKHLHTPFFRIDISSSPLARVIERQRAKQGLFPVFCLVLERPNKMHGV